MSATRRALPWTLAIAFAAATAPTASAQIQVSEKFTLTQVMDSVTITIEGYRPSARGRTIYGGVVPWEASWVAGAREPTTIEVGREFSINDTKVPAGKYTMWVMPRQESPWLLILDPRTDLNHWSDPDSTDGQYFTHLTVTPVDRVETLTWSIGDIRGYGSTASMTWGDRRVEFGLRLTSEYELAVSDADAAPLLGEYAASFPDTSGAWMDRIAITHEDGVLRLRFAGRDAEEWTEENVMILVPLGEDLYTWGESYEGELVQIMSGMIWEMTRQDGRVATFEIRGTPDDELWLTGTRLP